jgi:opacity protein-like surface antigen
MTGIRSTDTLDEEPGMSIKITLILIVVAVFAWPHQARAQAVGIGPRLSFIRGDLQTGTPAQRLFGGTLRVATSKHVALEAALDYRGELSADGRTRVRETPLQGSLLLFPVRAAFSPYLLGGYGIYTHSTDLLNATGAVASTDVQRKTGWHLGLGAELFVGRHAALFADYRFRFVHFGSTDAGAQPITIPGSGVIPGLNSLKLSHQGSMWTSGMAFYF